MGAPAPAILILADGRGGRVATPGGRAMPRRRSSVRYIRFVRPGPPDHPLWFAALGLLLAFVAARLICGRPRE